MPSQVPVITISDFVAAFHRGVKARREKREDGRSGSAYDYIGGTTSMLLARESTYIRDAFRAIYFNEAASDDLTELVAQRYKIPRILDTFGPGLATLTRASAAADVGQPQTMRTLFEGTRILIQGPGTNGLAYAVAADTPIASGALYIAGLPVRAVKTGLGAAIDTTISGQPATFDDPVWDPSWRVTSLRCADGTAFEQAEDFRARVRSLLLANRPGYETGIAKACALAGAVNVAVFGTNYGGVDLHSCATYVSDAGVNASPALVIAAKLALERWRMLGADMLIGPMASAALPVTAKVQLYDDPSKFDGATIQKACAQAIRGVLGATGAYGYDLDDLFGSVVDVSPAIQNVAFTTPTASVGLLVGSPPYFPQTLTRYAIPTNGISLTLVGPSGS